jgi:hypothetical protein
MTGLDLLLPAAAVLGIACFLYGRYLALDLLDSGGRD